MGRSNKHRRTVTSQDVAARAGVSRATISAVVNKSRYVSQDLVEKVEEAIRELGYTPNVVARSLKTQRTNTIGLVIPNVLSPVWTLVTRSVEVRARELGFNTIICDTDENLETERECVYLLMTRQVDGILIASCSIASENYLRPLVDEKPIVFLDRQPPTLEADYITPDKKAGAYSAVMHLREQGARRIAIISNMIEGQGAFLDTEWLGGYKQAHADAGLVLDDTLIRVGRRGPHSESDGYSNAMQLLRLPQPPEAIIACTHFTTMGVLRAAREVGISIPGDLALVGYDEVVYNEFLSPTLSVVSQPWDQMGRLGVDILAKRVSTTADDDQAAQSETHVLPVNLIVRQSSIWNRKSLTI